MRPEAGRRWLWFLPIASSRLLARFRAGSISIPPVDTLGLALGRRCGFGRVGASGYDPWSHLDLGAARGGGGGVSDIHCS